MLSVRQYILDRRMNRLANPGKSIGKHTLRLWQGHDDANIESALSQAPYCDAAAQSRSTRSVLRKPDMRTRTDRPYRVHTKSGRKVSLPPAAVSTETGVVYG